MLKILLNSTLVYDRIISESELVKNPAIDFQKTFDIIKQTEEVIEPYRANISNKSSFENP